MKTASTAKVRLVKRRAPARAIKPPMRQRIFRLLLSASFERSSSLASSQVLHSRKIATCWNRWKTFPESDQRSQTEKRFANRENTDRAGTNGARRRWQQLRNPGRNPGPARAARQEFLRRKDGATTAEIAKATGWQSHTIRAFLSAHVAKKMGPGVESVKNEDGERVYRIIPQDHGRDHSLSC